MSAFLRLGEAARQLGVSVDTLRRYIDDGRVPAFRTPGGQLQVRAEDVSALRGMGAVAPHTAAGRRSSRRPDLDDELEEAVDDQETAVQRPTRGASRPPSWKDMPPWEQRKAEAEADLEVERMARDREDEQADIEREDAAREARRLETARLDELKRGGKLWCWDSEFMPLVVRKLEEYVTTEQVPAWLSQWEQQHVVQQYVRNLVDEAKKRRKDRSR